MMKDESTEPLFTTKDTFGHEEEFDCSSPHYPWLKQKSTIALQATLILSLVSNALLILHLFWPTYTSSSNAVSKSVTDRTRYAGLARTLSTEFLYNSDYESENDTLADKLWDAISIDPGVVALSDVYAEEMHLPTAQRFAWDDTKGVYLLNAFHTMHCIKVIRGSVIEFQRGIAQTWPAEHVRHCLADIREEVVCNADDTPRWTSATREPESGRGQQRMCRDWNALVSWSQEHTACWRFINETRREEFFVDRYIYCPEGSEYQDAIEQYLKKKKAEDESKQIERQ